MDCLVDAGRIFKVRGKSARDCAGLALLELGHWPPSPLIVHHPATGDRFEFAVRPIPPVRIHRMAAASAGTTSNSSRSRRR